MTQLMPLAETVTTRFSIAADRVSLDGTLALPVEARGAVIFAHGSSASRLSPRNRAAARGLNEAGFATLLVDLLTIDEEAETSPAGQIDSRLALLSMRLLAATAQLSAVPDAAGLPIGYLGLGVGSAAALLAAARRPEQIAAIVSCGGLPDMASARLAAVAAPTLLIVGEGDHALITHNQAALIFLPSESALALIPGAHASCDRASGLELALPLAMRWFERFMS